jgi:hypothetical protein
VAHRRRQPAASAIQPIQPAISSLAFGVWHVVASNGWRISENVMSAGISYRNERKRNVSMEQHRRIIMAASKVMKNGDSGGENMAAWQHHQHQPVGMA